MQLVSQVIYLYSSRMKDLISYQSSKLSFTSYILLENYILGGGIAGIFFYIAELIALILL